MSGNNSVFANDWRDSLRAHFIEVVRRNDKKTEESLLGIMYDVGFREEELRQLKLEATMRAEDLADNFIPDLALPSPEETKGSVHPAVAVAEAAEDTYEPEAELHQHADDDPANEAVEDDDNQPDPNAPQQMSLF